MKQHHKVFSADIHPEKLIKVKIDKLSALRTKINNSSLSFSTLNNNASLTERNTASTKDSFTNNKGFESFLQKRLPKVRKTKKKEKRIEIFTFLPSTKHNATNTVSEKVAMTESLNHKHDNSIRKLKPLVLINKSIQLSIKEAIVKNESEAEKKMLPAENTRQKLVIKPSATERRNNNNYKIEYKQNKISVGKHDLLNEINPKISFPIICKDNSLFSDIYQFNLNYFKHSLHAQYNDNYP